MWIRAQDGTLVNLAQYQAVTAVLAAKRYPKDSSRKPPPEAWESTQEQIDAVCSGPTPQDGTYYTVWEVRAYQVEGYAVLSVHRSEPQASGAISNIEAGLRKEG